MKNAILPFRTTVKSPRDEARRPVPALHFGKASMAVVTVSIFIAAAQAGLGIVASDSPILLEIFVRACRLFLAARHIFGN